MIQSLREFVDAIVNDVSVRFVCDCDCVCVCVCVCVCDVYYIDVLPVANRAFHWNGVSRLMPCRVSYLRVNPEIE